MKLEFWRQIFEKYSNIKVHENQSCESRIVACELRGITELIVSFRNYVGSLLQIQGDSFCTRPKKMRIS